MVHTYFRQTRAILWGTIDESCDFQLRFHSYGGEKKSQDTHKSQNKTRLNVVSVGTAKGPDTRSWL